MKESIWMYFFMLMGILGIVLINIFGNITTTNQQDYYLAKEITYAAMYDSIDQVEYQNKYYTVPSPSGPCSLILNTDALNMVFGEGNKFRAVQKAIESPREINMKLVNQL